MKTQHLSRAEGKALLAKPAKKPKYRNVPCVIDGIRFQSTKEGAYYAKLKVREKLGEVSAVELQTPFALVGPDGLLISTYKADFCFWDHTADRFRVIDVKGVETKEFRIKKRLMKSLKGIEVELA
jgi:hypothetical protein